jgi:hypothetical protein
LLASPNLVSIQELAQVLVREPEPSGDPVRTDAPARDHARERERSHPENARSFVARKEGVSEGSERLCFRHRVFGL